MLVKNTDIEDVTVFLLSLDKLIGFRLRLPDCQWGCLTGLSLHRLLRCMRVSLPKCDQQMLHDDPGCHVQARMCYVCNYTTIVAMILSYES